MRILIVEDDRDVALVCQSVLSDDGYEVAIATSSAVAAAEARAVRPAAILLDLMMPEVNGWEVARQLRANPETADIPIVVMTAMHHAEERARQIGTPYVLGKPFNLSDLVDIMRTVVASNESQG